jgi:hypothetical protein
MMNRFLATLLAGSGIAAVGFWSSLPQQPAVLAASTVDPLIDSDEDFLPDVVEWAVLTNAANPDTDNDGNPDFVEVVQYGSPRQVGSTRVLDHEMRVVVTGPAEVSSPSPAWMHLLFRFVGAPSLMSSFQAWLELPGLPGMQVPIDVLGSNQGEFAQRQTATEGLWVRMSIPMVSIEVLRLVLPCSIHARAVIGGRNIATSVKLFDVQGVPCTLTPFNSNPNQLAVQTLGILRAGDSGSGGGTNRVCLLTLERAGTGPGGHVYEVVDASCEDCNELECAPSCPQSVGWVFTIPGGIETITGG